MRKALFLLFLLSFAALPLFAQSNDVLDEFLERGKADLGTSAYLILAAADILDESAEAEDAISWIRNHDLLGELDDLDADRNISYGEFSFIAMEALGLEGGLMYRLVPCPRYAAREAAYQKWILGKSAPGRSLKPFEVINAIVTIMETEGAS